MNSMTNPTYPALLVHEDRSISSLPDSETWSGDPDFWYWCDPLDYLVDNNGVRFEQIAIRAANGHPKQPPTWQRNRQLSLDEMKQLCREAFEAEPGDAEFLKAPIENFLGDDAPALIVESLAKIFKP